MGQIMKEDDVYIASLLDLLNIRFGLPQVGPEYKGGIVEMAALEKEFRIFQPHRSLRDCFAVLNLGGFSNARAKNRWLDLVDYLRQCKSDVDGQDAHARLLDLFVSNLAAPRPQPMYFLAHDARGRDGERLRIGVEPHAAFYIEDEHLVVSIPMRPKPRPASATRRPRKAR